LKLLIQFNAIQVDGEEPKEKSLGPESLHTIKAKSNIAIEVSDGGIGEILYIMV